MGSNVSTARSPIVGFLEKSWNAVKTGAAFLIYGAAGSVTVFIPLCICAAYFDLSNRSIWAWGLVIIPVIAGISLPIWRWTELKAKAEQYSLRLTQEQFEESKRFLGQCVVGIVSLPLLGIVILLLCGLSWGGYLLVAALPISVAILGGAGLIALAILALVKVSD